MEEDLNENMNGVIVTRKINKKKKSKRFQPYKDKVDTYADLELTSLIRLIPNIGPYFQGRMNSLGVNTIQDLLTYFNNKTRDQTEQILKHFCRNAQAGQVVLNTRGGEVQIGEVNVRTYNNLLGLLEWAQHTPKSQFGDWTNAFHLPTREKYVNARDMERQIEIVGAQLHAEDIRPAEDIVTVPIPKLVDKEVKQKKQTRVGPLHSSRIYKLTQKEHSHNKHEHILRDIELLERRKNEL